MVVIALSLGMVNYAITVIARPELRPVFLRERFITMPLLALAHLVGSSAALATAPFQFLPSIRNNHIRIHKWMGRIYVASVVIGGLGAFALSTVAQMGPPAQIGFGVLAILWIGTTTVGYLHIRRKDRVHHQRWMIRSYALAFAAVTLRLYLPVIRLLGVSFDVAYVLIAWISWIPNLLVVEWFLKRGKRRHNDPATAGVV